MGPLKCTLLMSTGPHMGTPDFVLIWCNLCHDEYNTYPTIQHFYNVWWTLFLSSDLNLPALSDSRDFARSRVLEPGPVLQLADCRCLQFRVEVRHFYPRIELASRKVCEDDPVPAVAILRLNTIGVGILNIGQSLDLMKIDRWLVKMWICIQPNTIHSWTRRGAISRQDRRLVHR